jgi:hypothetical protein
MKPVSVNLAASNPSAAMREYGRFDEQPADLPVDPTMYDKLGIKKAKLGAKYHFDVEKIYKFQLEEDNVKFTSKKGNYKVRNKKFLKIWNMDEEYKL